MLWEESPVSLLACFLEEHSILDFVHQFAFLLVQMEEHLLALLPILKEQLMVLLMILWQKYLLQLPWS